MKSLKYNVEAASKEASVTKIVYNANDGIIGGGSFGGGGGGGRF